MHFKECPTQLQSQTLTYQQARLSVAVDLYNSKDIGQDYDMLKDIEKLNTINKTDKDKDCEGNNLNVSQSFKCTLSKSEIQKEYEKTEEEISDLNIILGAAGEILDNCRSPVIQ